MEGQDLQIKLDIDRADRKEALNTLDASPSPTPSTDAPTHFGVDGRPAVVVPIHYD
jgi:hypothetical protein